MKTDGHTNELFNESNAGDVSGELGVMRRRGWLLLMIICHLPRVVLEWAGEKRKKGWW